MGKVEALENFLYNHLRVIAFIDSAFSFSNEATYLSAHYAFYFLS